LFDIYDNFQKLFKLYDTKLELSGIFVFTIMLIGLVLLIFLDDKEKVIGEDIYFTHFIPDYLRQIVVGLTIAHMLGLYAYSRKKTRRNPEAARICPNCGQQMSSIFNCNSCGGTLHIP
jgi:hypothetical protein